jgi:antitoxin VapB
MLHEPDYQRSGSPALGAAQTTGETITRVVTEALRERLERIQNQPSELLAADVQAIEERAPSHSKRPYQDQFEVLYDENGLPK